MSQVHSLKLTIQDVYTKDAAKIAAVLGTLFVDHGEKVLNEVSGEFEPKYEQINFRTALFKHLELQQVIRGLIVEALALEDLKIAKESNTLDHYVEAISGQSTKVKKTKRVSKTRKKK